MQTCLWVWVAVELKHSQISHVIAIIKQVNQILILLAQRRELITYLILRIRGVLLASLAARTASHAAEVVLEA
jgi:hypothetical protein